MNSESRIRPTHDQQAFSRRLLEQANLVLQRTQVVIGILWCPCHTTTASHQHLQGRKRCQSPKNPFMEECSECKVDELWPPVCGIKNSVNQTVAE